MAPGASGLSRVMKAVIDKVCCYRSVRSYRVLIESTVIREHLLETGGRIVSYDEEIEICGDRRRLPRCDCTAQMLIGAQRSGPSDAGMLRLLYSFPFLTPQRRRSRS